MSRSRAAVIAVVGLAVLIAASVALIRVLAPRPADEPKPVQRVGETMPDFELRDLSGRTWRRADLAGKVAFVNVWATWCGPCRQELPLLQQLHERLEGRPNVVLVSMNVDEEPGKVAPFVAEHGYTFPVLFAHAYVRTQLATRGIPRNWVIDASGVWHADQIGFDEAHAERWVSDAEGTVAAALARASSE